MTATQQDGGWWEYRLQASTLATISAALGAIRSAGLVGLDVGPDTMLGQLVVVDASNVVNPTFPLFLYGIGTASNTFTGPDGTSWTSPARGTVGTVYIALRARLGPPELPLDPTSLGLTWSDPIESAAVLGVWA